MAEFTWNKASEGNDTPESETLKANSVMAGYLQGKEEEAEPREYTANSIEELGAKFKAAHPNASRTQGETDYNVGKRVIELRDEGNPKYQRVRIVEGYGDIELGRAFANPKEDWGEVAGEQWEGIKEMVSSPIETGTGLQRLGAGMVDRLRGETPKSEFAHIDRLMDPNLPSEERPPPKEMIDAGVTPADPEMQRNIDALIKQGKFRVSAAGVEENPLRAISDILDAPLLLSGAGGIKKATGLTSKLAKLSKPKRAGLKIAELALDPAGAVIQGPVAGLQATAEVGRKAYNKASEMLATRKLRQGTAGLADEAIATVGGFTSGLGRRFIMQLRDRFQSKVKPPGSEPAVRFDDVWRDSRSKDIAVSVKDLLEKSFRAMDSWKDSLSKRYANKLQGAFRTEAGENTLYISMDGIVGELGDALKEFGYDVVETGAKSKRRKKGEKWKLKVRPRETEGVPKRTGGDMGQITDVAPKDRRVIMKQFERFLNEPDNVLAHELHSLRLLLDDNISGISTAVDASANTRRALSKLRTIIASHLEQNMPEKYRPAMQEYSKEINLLERAEKELGLSPGKVRWEKDLVTGERRPIDYDLVDYGTTIDRLSRTFRDDPKYSLQLELLEKIQDLGDDHTIIPALMGIQSSPIAGSGLVVRSEMSQIGRAVVAVGMTAEFGGLMALPAVILFSPKLLTEMFATMGDISRAPLLRKKVTRLQGLLEKYQKLNETTGGRMYWHARATGLNVAQYIERLEQDAAFGEEGINIGGQSVSSILKGPQAQDIDLEALRSIGIRPRKLNEPSLSLSPQDALGAR
tara:strand:- start:337 stop:2751 length:2415 start_codon:yes stop_codon:yes gene_type:complete